MAIPNDYQEIVEILAAATNEGRVKWSASRYDVAVTVSGSKFSLSTGKQDDGRAYVTFALFDSDGKGIDAWHIEEGDEVYDYMRQLCSTARRQALNIPQRLARLRDEIKTSPIIGDASPPSKNLQYSQ